MKRFVVSLLIIGVVISAFSAIPFPANAATPDSFVFGAIGDHSSSAGAASVMKGIGAANLDFFITQGDLSYDTLSPAAWCKFVKDNINIGAGKAAGDPYGETFPFELTEGNHEQTTYAQYPACLPDRMASTSLPGSAASLDYYFDYPKSDVTATPLARFIVMTPGLEYNMSVGSPQYTWLSNAIDQARATGIKWIIVSNHVNYITAGEKSDQAGPVFMNLLVQKKVDLLLQGHEHVYERSHQLSYGPNCTSVTKTTPNMNCVVASGSTGTYSKDNGLVLVIGGLGGVDTRSVNTADSEAPYFAKLYGTLGSPTYGYNKITVTADTLSSTFIRTGGAAFSDDFTISKSITPVPMNNVPITKTFTPAADATIIAASPTANYGSATTLQADKTPVEEFLTKYTVSGTSGYTIKSAKLRYYTTNPGPSGGSFYATSNTAWNEATVTYNTAPQAAASPFATVGNAAQNSWVEVDVTPLIKSDGTYSFRTVSTSDDGVDYSSKESATNKPQLVLTLEPIVQAPADTTAPVARILSPVNGSDVYGQVAVQTQTTDDSGKIVGTDFLINDVPMSSSIQTSPTFNWDATTPGTYKLQIRTYDQARNEGLSDPVTVTVQPDTTIPSAPAQLTATAASSSQINLNWSAATDDRGVAGYKIERDGIDLGVTVSGTAYTNTGLSPATQYSYVVKAIDSSGNVGIASPVAIASTTAVPAQPQVLTFTPTDDAALRKATPTSNYGKVTSLIADNDPVEHYILKFTVAGSNGRTVTNAKLRLYVNDGSPAGGTFYRVGNNNWSENTVNWTNSPAGDTAPLAIYDKPVVAGTFIDVDVTSMVGGDGVYSVRAKTWLTDSAGYNSRDAATNKPQLIVTY